MPDSEWTQQTLADILDRGISAYPSLELSPLTSVAVARWRLGDFGAAMWLYWDPDDLVSPFTHEIEVARWQDGRWRPLGSGHGGPAPGGLSWRPGQSVAWTATSQVFLGSSTLWVLGGVARDLDRMAVVATDRSDQIHEPDRQSCCLLIGVTVPPVATVSVDSGDPRRLGHWSAPGDYN